MSIKVDFNWLYFMICHVGGGSFVNLGCHLSTVSEVKRGICSEKKMIEIISHTIHGTGIFT